LVPDDLTPPVRKSMSDDELADLVKNAQGDEAALLNAMQILGDQAKLREEDDKALASWISKTESLGTPEAKFAVENAKRISKGLEPLQPEPAAVQVPAPIEEPAPIQELAASEEPEPEAASAEIVDQELPAPVASIKPADPIQDIKPMSALVEIGIAPIAAKPEVLEHDLAPGLNEKPEEVFDVEVNLSTGVAVSDFDAILENANQNDDLSFEPEDLAEPDDENLEPRAVDQKTGANTKPIAQFWTWLAISTGVFPLGLGLILRNFNVTGVHALTAVVAGVLASGVLVSIGAVAGKRSGLSTLIVSRATFGVFGNLVPGIPVVAVKLFSIFTVGLL